MSGEPQLKFIPNLMIITFFYSLDLTLRQKSLEIAPLQAGADNCLMAIRRFQEADVNPIVLKTIPPLYSIEGPDDPRSVKNFEYDVYPIRLCQLSMKEAVEIGSKNPIYYDLNMKDRSLICDSSNEEGVVDVSAGDGSDGQHQGTSNPEDVNSEKHNSSITLGCMVLNPT